MIQTETKPKTEHSPVRSGSRILTPRSFTGSLAEAHDLARREKEPVFVPASIYADDRGWSIMNQFHGVLTHEGQINFSLMYPQVVKAWHRHQLQSDFWMCVQGQLRVGIHREADGQSWSIVTGVMRPGILIIPPPLWHGAATVGVEPAGLLYYVTHAYNAQAPDEERRAYDFVAAFPWTVQHR